MYAQVLLLNSGGNGGGAFLGPCCSIDQLLLDQRVYLQRSTGGARTLKLFITNTSMEGGTGQQGYHNPHKEAADVLEVILQGVDKVLAFHIDREDEQEEWTNPLPRNEIEQLKPADDVYRRCMEFDWPINKDFTADIGSQAVLDYAKVSSCLSM